MNRTELKHLRRVELLEIMLDQQKDIEYLHKRVEELETQLNDRKINLHKAGSIAEAALVMNGMFEAAEASCAQYIENLERMDKEHEEIQRSWEKQAKEYAENIIKEAEAKCAALEAKTKQKCEARLAEADNRER